VLSQAEIDLMNEIKEEGVRLQSLVDRIQGMEGTDKRWASIWSD
jgi:nitrogen-specific signal transduction histidine kinase